MTTHTLSTGIVMTLGDDRGAPYVLPTGDLSRWDATPESEVEDVVARWGYTVDWLNLGVYGSDALPLDPM